MMRVRMSVMGKTYARGWRAATVSELPGRQNPRGRRIDPSCCARTAVQLPPSFAAAPADPAKTNPSLLHGLGALARTWAVRARPERTIGPQLTCTQRVMTRCRLLWPRLTSHTHGRARAPTH